MPSTADNALVGHAAVRAGSQDHRLLDPQTSLADALANILHHADSAGLDFDDALASATSHFNAESISPQRD